MLCAAQKGAINQEAFYTKDKMVDCVPIFWKSFRLQRVARSTSCGETLSALTAFDTGQFFRESLENVLGHSVSVTQVTDCKSLKDNVDSIVPKCTEKRLKIDINAIREAVTNKELEQFLWCDTKHQIADCLTKDMDSSDIIRIFKEGVLFVGMSDEQAAKMKKKKEKQALRASRETYWRLCQDRHA